MRTQFLQRTVEVLHNEAKFCQVFLLMYHVEQRGIIFIDDNHHLLTCLLVGTLHESIQPVVGVQFILITAIEFFKWLQLQVEIMLQALPVNMLGTAHIEMEHRVLHPILLVISDGKSFEEFLPALEIGLQSRCKKRLSESPWATQKDIPHAFLSEIHDVFRLIHIEVSFLSNHFESLYAYRIFIHYFCHILTYFTFCAAKLQRKTEYTKFSPYFFYYSNIANKDIASIRLSSRTYLFSSKKVSKSHFSKVLISYIYDIEIFTSNDTSLKRREKVSLMSHRSIIKDGTEAQKESNQRSKMVKEYCPKTSQVFGHSLPTLWAIAAQYTVCRCPCDGHKQTNRRA